METAAFLKAFLGLFAMMNPIGNTGIFISMTGDLSARFKARAALKVTIVVLIILVGAVFGGTAILNTFGISLPAFQLAGGLIVLGIGFKMLKGGENEAHTTSEGSRKISAIKSDESKETAVNNSLIVPLSMPILGGPGSITTVVTVAAAYPGLSGQIGAAAGTAALTVTMGICFALSGLLQRFITPHAQQIILRFMGMLLIAIAADMMLTGFEQSLGGGVKQIVPEIVEEVDRIRQPGQSGDPTTVAN